MREQATRGIRLRAINGDDVEPLRGAEFDAIGPGWRSRGSTPSPSQYAEQIWMGVLAQVLAIDEIDRNLIGWYQCYNAEFENGVAWLGAARVDKAPATRFGFGAAMFIEHVFTSFSFHKLFVEVPATSYASVMPLVGRLLNEEGCLRDRVFAGGSLQDVSILSLTRADWTVSVQRRAVTGG